MADKSNILISPLNWGLGHASRLIPIILYLKENEYNIVIGGDGTSIELLKSNFPDLTYVYIPSTNLTYGKKKSFSVKFYLHFIKFVINIFKEHSAIKKIIKKYNINTIISDNRLGLYNKKVKSFYISHQLNIYLGKERTVISKIATYAHRSYIKKYDHCFVPDINKTEESLTGRLTEKSENLTVQFIGPISRFPLDIEYSVDDLKYDYFCILSGPEPQRTIFEDILVSIFEKTNKKIIILRGLPNCSDLRKDVSRIKFINHINDNELLNYIKISKRIICRSGYSTIMDLVNIGRRAILVSTPDQPEQEYLAIRLSSVHGFVKIDQKDLINTNFESLKYEELWDFNKNSKYLTDVLKVHL